MATTSLWRVKGRIGRVIDYIENPDKTSEKPPDPGGGKATIRDVLDYVTRDAATDHSRLVTAINCHLETASEEMRKTKEDFGKPGGTIAYHGYQSFKEGEVTPEKAHMIGCRLAEELWGGRYEVIVATHVDKESHIKAFSKFYIQVVGRFPVIIPGQVTLMLLHLLGCFFLRLFLFEGFSDGIIFIMGSVN